MVLETYLASIKPPTRFTSEKITKADLLKMMEAVRWAPSADNQQIWRFIVVETSTIKMAIRTAIDEQDPRLTTSLGTNPIPLTEKELDKMGLNFSPGNYDPSLDSFRDDIKEVCPADHACAETAGALIICTFQPQFLGRTFGELELGGAVLNLYLLAHKLGYRARIIRNFNRDLVRNACKIPESLKIPVIIAIGFAIAGETLPDLNNLEEEERAKKGISLVDLILDRRSVRSYSERIIPENILSQFQKLLEILPTFTRKKFIDLRLINDTDLLQRIAKQARIVFVKQKQVRSAPVVATIAYKVNGAAGYYGRMDVGMVFQAILLEAYSEGIGTCWIGAFHHRSMRDILQIPEDWRIEGLIAMGYPKEYPQPPPRLPIANITFQDVWDAPLTTNRTSKFGKSGLTSLIRRNYKPTDAQSTLRDREAGHPLVAGFKEAYEGRVSQGKMV